MRDNSDTQDVDSYLNEDTLIDIVNNQSSVNIIETMVRLMFSVESGGSILVVKKNDTGRDSTVEAIQQLSPSTDPIQYIEDTEKFSKRMNAGHNVLSTVEANSANEGLQKVEEKVHRKLLRPLDFVIALDGEEIVEVKEVSIEGAEVSAITPKFGFPQVYDKIQSVNGWSDVELGNEHKERRVVLQYCSIIGDSDPLTEYIGAKHGDGDLEDTQIGTVIQEAL